MGLPALSARDIEKECLELKNKRKERKMCSRTTCRKCGKPSWSGCGQHIEIALKGVAKKDRCQGHANDPKEPGFFSKLFGKGA